MSFSQKEYVFSHTMNKLGQAHQPAMFKINLRDIIPFREYSTLFVIDNMRINAYKQGGLETIPVMFTVVNDNTKRVLTNDPCKLSSEWHVDINGGSYMKIAGTDVVPFKRNPSVYDGEHRQAFANVLAFMMSNSLWASDRARGAFDILIASTRGEFEFTCDMCSGIRLACVVKGPSGLQSFNFPQCADSYVCIPSPRPDIDKDYEALRDILALLRSASLDNLDIFKLFTLEMASNRCFEDLNCAHFPPRHIYTGGIVIPYVLMKYITSFYQTMSEYADNIAIIDENTPHIKVLIESPSENIGEITGCLSLTLIYGLTLSDIYTKFTNGLRREDEIDEEEIYSHATFTQLSTDVLVRRTRLDFMFKNRMPLKDWYDFYYG